MSKHDLILIAVAIAAGAIAYGVVRNRENRFTKPVVTAQGSNASDVLSAEYMLNTVPFGIDTSGINQQYLTSTQNALAVASYQNAQYQDTQERFASFYGG